MELLLILYAMLAGLTGLSGQSPARAQVTLGSTTTITASQANSGRVAVRIVVRAVRAPGVPHVVPDARRIASALPVIAAVAFARVTTECRRE
ncbi:hypothetical protein ACFO8O_10840 [Hephaestia sp. GCM10023244]|uniref:hypothetical protein n=1 Tax=unclassified Hephaestia TaxID=2631281 RepID=UPI0020778644|nr:hypothetical protein [Hephaestia sp. MAHUQ-44]MCM8731456.1 hypothetical protein [Hephaestia sp. MAHUQ-44]